jgi:uncharacterized protein YeeX (DUF496 family)
MITNFEDYSEDLTSKDIPLIEFVIDHFINMDMNEIILSDELVELANQQGLKLYRTKLCKIVKAIRKNSKNIWIVGTSDGYFKTQNVEEIKKHIESMEQNIASRQSQINAALKVLEGLSIPEQPELF